MELENIKNQAISLWQGKGCDATIIAESTNLILDKIQQYILLWEEKGIVFPMEYVKEAVNHMNKANEKKDDYDMADCLYYEWNEIGMVVNELIEELELR